MLLSPLLRRVTRPVCYSLLGLTSAFSCMSLFSMSYCDWTWCCNKRKMSTKISTSKAPGAIAPYSQAIMVGGGTLYLSGQIGMGVDGVLEEGVEGQTEKALRNLEAVLRAANLELSDLVKVNIMLSSMDHYGPVNTIYEKIMAEKCTDGEGEKKYPARAAFAVKGLPKG